MRGDSGYAYLPAGQAEVEFGKYEQRIRQLEKLNTTLAVEVDRMRPVVEAAVLAVSKTGLLPMTLIEAVTTYQASNPK